VIPHAGTRIDWSLEGRAVSLQMRMVQGRELRHTRTLVTAGRYCNFRPVLSLNYSRTLSSSFFRPQSAAA